jgi:hypothetical protein
LQHNLPPDEFFDPQKCDDRRDRGNHRPWNGCHVRRRGQRRGSRRAFFHEGSEEWQEANSNKNLIGKRDDKTDDNIVDEIKKKRIDKEEDPECAECGESPCVFFQHEELLVEYDDAEYGLTTSVEPLPDNNIRRKKLYRQLTLMLNGGPLGAGVRKPLPSCCVSAIRDMHPSDTFMGFKSD